ncbi:hypothetical protein [Streptococcus australis]|uniref:hypothetical protein n=1 Tax=Streptococcus australis TaxID=113107 RepID=UPI0021ADBF75|nr:hypothetical protein [Streptococcus australis]
MYDQNSPNNKWSQETFQRISELEKLEQNQAKLRIMKEQMKNNLHWRNATLLGIFFSYTIFPTFWIASVCYHSSCSGVLLFTSIPKKKSLVRRSGSIQ